jgi:hypothetical protein
MSTREEAMLAYLRALTLGLLTLLAVSSATVAPAMAGPEHPIDWGDGTIEGDF